MLATLLQNRITGLTVLARRIVLDILTMITVIIITTAITIVAMVRIIISALIEEVLVITVVLL